MRKILPILLLLLIGVPFLAGCPGAIDGRPPEYSVANPSLLTLPNNSSIFVSYQVNRGNSGETYLQRLELNGEARFWGTNGLELSTSQWGFYGSDRECAALIPDNAGNLIAVYPLDDGLKAQKLNTKGDSIWPEGEVPVSGEKVLPNRFKAVSDRAGGALIISVSEEDRLTLRRIDTHGDLLWTTSLSEEADRFDIAVDTNGTDFVIWKDRPPYSEGDFFVQVVNANGAIVGENGGLRLTDENNPGSFTNNFENRIVADGSGGAVVIWAEAIFTEDRGGITGHRLFAQRIDGQGEPVWQDGGRLVTGSDRIQNPQIVESEPGTFLILWSDIRRIYGQKIDASGTIAWTGEGRELALSGSVLYFTVAGDDDGGAVLAWNDERLCAQRIDSNGSKLWGDEGIDVSSAPPYWGEYSVPARVSPDGRGNFIIAWASGSTIKAKTTSWVQKISAQGEPLWGKDGVRLGLK